MATHDFSCRIRRSVYISFRAVVRIWLEFRVRIPINNIINIIIYFINAKKKMIWKFESLVEVGKRVIFYKYKN